MTEESVYHWQGASTLLVTHHEFYFSLPKLTGFQDNYRVETVIDGSVKRWQHEMDLTKFETKLERQGNDKNEKTGLGIGILRHGSGKYRSRSSNGWRIFGAIGELRVG